jgi:hypothetical protein
MRLFLRALSVVGCLLASLLITWLVWETQIDGRAFRCTDGGPFSLSLGFWTSIDTHQSAGDPILPGWTWEKLRLTRRAYEVAFLALWIAGSALVFRVLRHISTTELRENPR